ncbi:helix-hairpin-helix domain-containing protein [Kitasatospora sp. NPDC054939]
MSDDPFGLPEPVRGGGLQRFGRAVLLDRRAAVGLGVLLLIAVAYAAQHFWLGRPQEVPLPVPRAEAVASAGAAPAGPGVPGPSDAASPYAPSPAAGGPAGAVAPGTPGAPGGADPVVVDIAGRVPTPGVHTLPGGARVADALRVAGGALPGTDTRALNLARVLTDGEQILVGETAVPQPPQVQLPAPVGTAPRQPISLNRATLEQLDTLPGVGPTLARRILAHRQAHGPFRSLDQLRQVGGIGERTYAELRPLLTL